MISRTLLYAPMVYRHDKGFWPPTTPSTWYFQWQKELWEYFSEQKGLKVIWKAWHTSNVKDPISTWETPNIRYNIKRMWREMGKADFVFVDYPSSVMLDASMAGKPCICITHIRDKSFIREDCMKSLPIFIVHHVREAINLLDIWIWSEKDSERIPLHETRWEDLFDGK